MERIRNKQLPRVPGTSKREDFFFPRLSHSSAALCGILGERGGEGAAQP